jgi:hypothetical protein
MKTYVITHTQKPSRTPFKVKAESEEAALTKVCEHMGMDCYKVIKTVTYELLNLLAESNEVTI